MSADLSTRDEFAIRFFLDAIGGQASAMQYFELRYRVAPQTLASSFVQVGDPDGVLEQVALRADRGDVYIGCAPRARRAGGKDAIREVWTLWAECDGAAAASAALDFRPSPAMVIASGSGPNLHAYWPLARPVSPRVAEDANHRLPHLLGADPVCFDAARILRPPATWNHKQRPPRRVELSHIRPGLRYELGEVMERVPQVVDERIARRWRDQPSRRAGRDPLLRIPPPVYVAELLGVRSPRGAKVHCPFHRDEIPSLHVYATAERGWSCFSCGRGGSIYDLAAGLWGYETRGRDFIRLRTALLERFTRDLSRSYWADRR
jgi:hypothetical protein